MLTLALPPSGPTSATHVTTVPRNVVVNVAPAALVYAYAPPNPSGWVANVVFGLGVGTVTAPSRPKPSTATHVSEPLDACNTVMVIVCFAFVRPVNETGAAIVVVAASFFTV